MKNGREIKPSEAAELTEDPKGTFTLRIHAPVPEDSGAYVFEVSPLTKSFSGYDRSEGWITDYCKTCVQGLDGIFTSRF